MQADNEYWAALSQLLPVLALALTIEVRAFTKGWTAATPRLYRFLFGLSVVVVMIGLVLTEMQAIRALRGGYIWPRADAIAENSIAFALGLLVIGPAFELAIRSNAEGWAGLATRLALGRSGRLYVRSRSEIVSLMASNLRDEREIKLLLDRGEYFIAEKRRTSESISAQLEKLELVPPANRGLVTEHLIEKLRDELATLDSSIQEDLETALSRRVASWERTSRSAERRRSYFQKFGDASAWGRSTKEYREELADNLRAFGSTSL